MWADAQRDGRPGKYRLRSIREFGARQQISTGFACWFVYCSDVAHRRNNQTLHDVWPSLGLVHCIYIFGSSCPLTEFCQVQNSLYVQVLRSPILAALLHGTSAVGARQTFRRGTRNGIMELSQRAPPIFGWAAIMLGIGAHSSFT